MYELILRRLLFCLEPETAHRLVMALLRLPPLAVVGLVGRTSRVDSPDLRREVFGLSFPNPVGLAAGFDKNARVYRQMGRLGFGFVEIGTVTPRPQPGNPRPRLFRLPEDEALINRMGFNNEGVEAVAARLGRRPKGLIIGGNIGKNKTTPNDRAVEDYEICFRKLYDQVDYFVVNVSSPNTPGLRALQEKGALRELLQHLQALNRRMPSPRPLLLKIAPDLTPGQLDDIIEVVQETGLAGIIATNTTVERRGLRTSPRKLQAIGEGGLSGRPLRERATEVIRYLHRASGGAFPIIGVGGIHSPKDALEKMEAGASLIQLYTGLIYRGPGLVGEIKRRLVRGQAL